MKGPAKENELAKKSKEMNGKIPSQYINKDFGKKRKAHNHKFSVKSTKTGQTYWVAAIAEDKTMKFKDYLIREATETKILDNLTELPDSIISEIKKLIKFGAKDLTQQWENALELCNTAYKVSNIKLPVPVNHKSWKQYTELLKFAVHELADARGMDGDWRQTDKIYKENYKIDSPMLLEKIGGKRYFVKIPGQMSVEVEGDNMTEVLRELINKFKRHGAGVDIVHRSQEGAVIQVLSKGEPVEEVTIQELS